MSKSKMPDVATPSPEPTPDHLDEYKVRSAMDDMMRAEEHKQNPKMMVAIQKHVKKKAKAINSLAALKIEKRKVDAKANAAAGAPPTGAEEELEHEGY